MARLTVDVEESLVEQISRIVRDGWFPDEETVVIEALEQFVEAKSFLGDSPRMLHRFGADALNESKPETALKFVDRALSLLASQKVADLQLYQQLVELRVQSLIVIGRTDDAFAALQEAQERLPNNPGIRKWIERLRSRRT